MKGLVAFACLLILGQSTAAQTPESTRLPIIDMHLHALPLTYGGGKNMVNPITGEPAPVTDEEVMRKTFEALDKNNIIRAVTSGPLDFVKRWKTANPNRVIGSLHLDEATLNTPNLASLILTEYEKKQIEVLGEVGAQYMGLTPGDPILEPYLSLAEELGIPIGFHTGLAAPGTPYGCCPRFRVALGNPLLFEDMLIRHPNLRVYLMHAGHPFLEETIGILTIYPQVYVDIGAIDWIIPRESFYYYLRRLVEAGFAKRIMFGSDQVVWPEVIGIAVDSVESADFLTPEQKRDVFYNNAVRFLGIEQDTENDER